MIDKDEQETLNHKIELLSGVGFTPRQLWFVAFAWTFDEEAATVAVFGNKPMPYGTSEVLKQEYLERSNEASAIDRLEGLVS